MDTRESNQTNYDPPEGSQDPRSRQNHLQPMAAATANTSILPAGSYNVESTTPPGRVSIASYGVPFSRMLNSSNPAPCGYTMLIKEETLSWKHLAHVVCTSERMENHGNVLLPQENMAVWDGDPFPVCKNDEEPTMRNSYCNCKKSQCLQRYCDCFNIVTFCTDKCTCHECHNTYKHEEEVFKRREEILKEKPDAFDSKIVSRDETYQVSPSGRHKTGCNCPKSKCIKRYCECYKAGVGCSILCRCNDCQNNFGRKNDAESIRRSGLRQNQWRPVGDSCSEEPHPGNQTANNSLLPYPASFPTSSSTVMLKETGRVPPVLGLGKQSWGNCNATTMSDFATEWSSLGRLLNPSSSSHRILGPNLVQGNGHNSSAAPLPAVPQQSTETSVAQRDSNRVSYTMLEIDPKILEELLCTEVNASSLGEQQLPPQDNVQEGISSSPPAS
ncbi:uncharacterized protein [Typha angustifolia]|uniref:uncharacterized protein n=1 Tax=Typha angustifolia TaxID=59011 RepID=UPI003C2D4396